jgi:hypothetical protein
MNVEKLKRRWQRDDEFKIDSAVSQMLESVEGRKFLWWLLGIGRVGMQPFAGNALQTAFGCGELNVGQRILDRIISVSPEGYLKMMEESSRENRERDDLLEAEANGTGTPDGAIDAES